MFFYIKMIDLNKPAIDLNEPPSDDLDNITVERDEHSLENTFEPFIGQCFLSEEEAYKFYENS